MTKNDNALCSFEQEVLKMLLDGDDPVLTALRRQFEVCRTSQRDFTGVGFFTTLLVDRSAPPAVTPRRRMIIQGVGANMPKLKFVASFVLFVTDGYLDCLEGFTYDEPWPSDVSGYTLHYEGKFGLDPGANRIVFRSD